MQCELKYMEYKISTSINKLGYKFLIIVGVISIISTHYILKYPIIYNGYDIIFIYFLIQNIILFIGLYYKGYKNCRK